MDLGLFMMPMHDPAKDYATALEEDREAVILADRLGFAEAWIGEHYSSKAEQITSPLIFLATLIGETENIRLGTGVINLPQHHPAVVAAHCAMFDQLSGGRLMLGIGSGGLASDFELFGRTDPKARTEMMMESIDQILRMWTEQPPVTIGGEHWTMKLEDAVFPHLGVGQFARPAQQPHPPIAMSVLSPFSGTARTAGERGWIPVSANFLQDVHLPGHWQIYAEACDKAGRRPDRSVWRVARSILVTESDGEAEDYLANPESGVSFYFDYLLSLLRVRNAVKVFKADPDLPDDDVTVPYCVETMTIAGSPKTVLDKLVALHDLTGNFGTLVMTAHDWDDKAMWMRSAELLATQVMPRFNDHVGIVSAAE